MLAKFHLYNEKQIFTSKEFLASDEVFASTAELCLVNFSLFSLLWNCGIAVTFYFFMLLLTFLFVSLILILLILNTLFRDQS